MTNPTVSPRVQRALEQIEAAFEKAAESCFACEIFREWSEIRVAGTQTEEAQGLFIARMALAYWLEALADKDDLCPSDLVDFKSHADALKARSDDYEIVRSIDAMIAAIGSLTVEPRGELKGIQHALLAAYQIDGDISRAYEILCASGGVSGASMNGVQIP